MSRSEAISQARSQFDSGEFRQTLARRVALPTESQNPARAEVLTDYLETEMKPAFEAMGFECRLMTHPLGKAPFLFAQRIEDPALPTVFGYGHGDVIRGLDKEWHEGLSPWALTERDGRWYGRGIADNKGQHSVNMQALANVLKVRGQLGFNAKYLIEMGEEVVSPGLRALAGTTAERSPQMPQLPTVIEGGMPGFDADIWYGLLLPAKTPADIVQKVSADLGRVMADPDTQTRLRQRGLEPAYLEARQMGELMARDVARWKAVAERIKLALC